MQTIIAARFEQQSEVQNAVEEMLRAGFPSEHVTHFYLNPPGRHDTYPIGGDQDESPGAENSKAGLAAGAATGGVLGAAVGAATAPVTGPLGAITGAFVGAHLGNMAGGLGSMKDDGDDPTLTPPSRIAGMMIAVGVDSEDQATQAVALLRQLGAMDIERAAGNIIDGDWRDFNPVSTPHFAEGWQDNRGPDRHH